MLYRPYHNAFLSYNVCKNDLNYIQICTQIRERKCLYQALITSSLFLAFLLRMGGYRILPRVRPQIIYLGRTSQIPCDKKNSYSTLSTLVSLGSKGVYIGVLSTRMYSLLIPLSFTLSAFEMVSRVKRHDSHVAGHLHDLRCHYSQKDPKLYTPLSWQVMYLASNQAST